MSALIGLLGNLCQNRAEDCATRHVHKENDICTSRFTMVRTWARENCKEFCGLCPGVPRGPDSVSFSPVGPLFVKNKDDQFTIRCVSNCTPSCSYTWTRQVQNIHITLSNTNTLSFNRILPSDAGQYKCTVRNAHGEITVTKYGKMVLIVKGTPTITSTIPQSTSKLPSVPPSTSKLPSVSPSTSKLPSVPPRTSKLPSLPPRTSKLPSQPPRTSKLPTLSTKAIKMNITASIVSGQHIRPTIQANTIPMNTRIITATSSMSTKTAINRTSGKAKQTTTISNATTMVNKSTLSNATVVPPVGTTRAMVTIAPKDITCAVCAGPPEACELAYYETTCHPPDHYCINHITTKETGQRLVERRCGNIHDCYNDWYLGSSDDDKCRQLSATNILTYNFECSYCCIKDRCNVDLHPKHDTLYMNV